MDEKDTNRLEAFSDGVFAVAITLLVLNIKIPGLDTPGKPLDDKDLWNQLLNQWPMLVAYVTSFATVGIMWLNHHRVFSHIRRTSTLLLLFNLLLLLVVVFIPVPTALLSAQLAYPDHHTAALIYSGTNIIMAVCFNLVWNHASVGGRLLDENVDMRSVAAIRAQYRYGPLLYVVAFLLAWISAPACVIFSFALALFFALPGRPLRLLPEKGKRGAGKDEVLKSQG
ncbi:MAG: TMEM175 family protein [Ktedonobacteraceae bacterium]